MELDLVLVCVEYWTPQHLHADFSQFIHKRVNDWLRCFRSRRRLSTPGFCICTPVPLVDVERSVTAARGMLTTASLTGSMGFLITILFLFCTPDLTTLFSLDAPQPFVQIYALALGRGASIFMTMIAVLGLIMVQLPPYSHLSIIDTTASLLSAPPPSSSLLPVSSSPWPAMVSCPSPPGSAESTTTSNRKTR